MKAVWVREIGPFENVKVEEVADPVAAAGEVIVDVAFAETNFPDMLVIEGKYQHKPTLPFAPGKAVAGIVSALGAGVSTVKIGDRVAAQVEHGAFAEKARVVAANCFSIPSDVPLDAAAALGLVYQTSWFALKERAHFKAGETVLVLGAAGGVGMAAVQLARALGAKTVIGGVRGEANAQAARKMGADHIIDLRDPNLRDALRDQVNAITGGNGVDVVIDPVGGEANAAALRAMAWCGRLVIVGFTSGEIASVKTNYLLIKNIAVTGLQISDYRDKTPKLMEEAQNAIFDLYRAKKIYPFISARLPLERFQEALIAFRDGKAQGKILLQAGKA